MAELVLRIHVQAVAAELLQSVMVPQVMVVPEDRGLEILQLTLEEAEVLVNQDLVLDQAEAVAADLEHLESVEHPVMELMV
jgi:hypothetical protein